jgi:STIP1 family protein 1
MRQFLEASNEQIVFSIPDYLQCRITLEIMEDPVMTDSGQTYEREALELHIEKNGRTDPFTRQPIKGALYPNVAIRKAVQDFLERNPWAYEYTEGENYKDIIF